MTILFDLEFPDLDAAVNEDAWHWLTTNAEGYARAVQSEIKRGRSPEQIRERFARRAYGLRPEMAARLEQAAAYLVARGAS